MANQVSSYYRVYGGLCPEDPSSLTENSGARAARLMAQAIGEGPNTFDPGPQPKSGGNALYDPVPGSILERSVFTLFDKNNSQSVFQSGKVCYLEVNGAQHDVFMRVQQVMIQESSIKQLRTTFDGIYASVYGGAPSMIKVSGITHMWSAKRVSGPYGGGGNAPPNLEITYIHNALTNMVNSRGGVFNFHDGFRARKWKVIPNSFSSVKSVGANNLEQYDITFIGASFKQKFQHVENAGGELVRFSGPMARFSVRNVL